VTQPTAASVRIRIAGADDARDVLALLAAHGSDRRSTDDEEAVALAIRSRTVLVATADGALVGAVVAGFDGWRGNMYRLTVDAAYRRLGVATALVRAAERRLARRGCRRITILANQEEPGVVEFWESVGYSPDHELVRAVKDLPR
jgi:ribosomal protein S18 acetylase RimI-like enzyme